MNLLWSTKTAEEAKDLIDHDFEYVCVVEDAMINVRRHSHES